MAARLVELMAANSAASSADLMAVCWAASSAGLMAEQLVEMTAAVLVLWSVGSLVVSSADLMAE